MALRYMADKNDTYYMEKALVEIGQTTYPA